MPCDRSTREELAKLLHELWSGWTQHMALGTLEDQKRWKEQASTRYENLSEHDKEKDRREADKVIALLERKGALKVGTGDELTVQDAGGSLEVVETKWNKSI